MRYANIAFFVVATMLGFSLSYALMWQLPFGAFVLSDSNIATLFELIEKQGGNHNSDVYFAKAALEDLLMWKDVVNYVVAVVCGLIVVMPALATVWVAEGKLFDRRVDRGWKMMLWMVILGSMVVAIYPAPKYILPFIIACTLLIAGYIVTYQWPKAKIVRRTSDPINA